MRVRLRYALVLALGGAVWGSLLGIFLGAFVGVIYGALTGDVGLGLDGAVLGCFALAALGGVYGLALAVGSGRRSASPDRPGPPRWEDAARGAATRVRV
jgi:hypothetical protein